MRFLSQFLQILLEPPPPLETSRTFFEAPEALFILQALRLRVVYISIKAR